MSIRALMVTCLGIACGLFAVMGIKQMRQMPLSGVSTKAKVVQILVVDSDVPRGYVIDEPMVALRDWPADLVPEEALLESEQAIGRIALSKLVKGEPLLDRKLAPAGVGRGAGNLVAPGFRAYSIMAVNAASSVAGLILPGDCVDVILSIQTNVNDSTGGGTSTTLLQNVEILAIDQELEAPAENRADPGLSTVTLLVTQHQASLLALGMKAGVLSLSLRNPEDDQVAKTDPVTMAGVRFREEAPAAKEPKSAGIAKAIAAIFVRATQSAPRKEQTVHSIRTLRGSHSSLIAVAGTKGN